jgi:hypothetical protein
MKGRGSPRPLGGVTRDAREARQALPPNPVAAPRESPAAAVMIAVIGGLSFVIAVLALLLVR